MIYSELVENLIDYISESGMEKDVAEAKKLYFEDAGGLHGDEESFDMRIGSFLEWYVIDRMKGGKALYEGFGVDSKDEHIKDDIENLKSSIRSIFEVKWIYKEKVYLKDMSDGKRYSARISGDLNLFKSGNIIETRLYPKGKRYFLSDSYIFHPHEMKKFISTALKDASLKNNFSDCINMLANMSLKLEKYKHYKAKDIYKLKEN